MLSSIWDAAANAVETALVEEAGPPKGNAEEREGFFGGSREGELPRADEAKEDIEACRKRINLLDAELKQQKWANANLQEEHKRDHENMTRKLKALLKKYRDLQARYTEDTRSEMDHSKTQDEDDWNQRLQHIRKEKEAMSHENQSLSETIISLRKELNDESKEMEMKTTEAMARRGQQYRQEYKELELVASRRRAEAEKAIQKWKEQAAEGMMEGIAFRQQLDAANALNETLTGRLQSKSEDLSRGNEAIDDFRLGLAKSKEELAESYLRLEEVEENLRNGMIRELNACEEVCESRIREKDMEQAEKIRRAEFDVRDDISRERAKEMLENEMLHAQIEDMTRRNQAMESANRDRDLAIERKLCEEIKDLSNDRDEMSTMHADAESDVARLTGLLRTESLKLETMRKTSTEASSELARALEESHDAYATAKNERDDLLRVIDELKSEFESAEAQDSHLRDEQKERTKTLQLRTEQLLRVCEDRDATIGRLSSELDELHERHTSTIEQTNSTAREMQIQTLAREEAEEEHTRRLNEALETEKSERMRILAAAKGESDLFAQREKDLEGALANSIESNRAKIAEYEARISSVQNAQVESKSETTKLRAEIEMWRRKADISVEAEECARRRQREEMDEAERRRSEALVANEAAFKSRVEDLVSKISELEESSFVEARRVASAVVAAAEGTPRKESTDAMEDRLRDVEIQLSEARARATSDMDKRFLEAAMFEEELHSAEAASEAAMKRAESFQDEIIGETRELQEQLKNAQEAMAVMADRQDDRDVEFLESKLEALVRKYKVVYRRAVDAEKELGDLRREHEASERRGDVDKEARLSMIATAEFAKRESYLQTTIDALKSEKTALRKDLAAAIDSKEDIQLQANALRTALSDLEARTRAQLELRAKENANVADSERERALWQDEKTHLLRENAEAKSREKALKAALDSEKASFQKEVSAMRAKLASADAASHADTLEKKAIEEVSETKRVNERLRSELLDRDSQIQSLREKLDAAKSRGAEGDGDAEDVSVLKTRIRDLEEHHREDVGKLREKLKRLLQKYKSLQRTMREKATTNGQNSTSPSSSDYVEIKMAKERQLWTEKLAASETLAQSLREELAACRLELQSATSDENELRQRFGNADKRVRELEQALEKAKQRAESKEASTSRSTIKLKQRLAALVAKYKDLKKSATLTEKKSAKMKDELRKIREAGVAQPGRTEEIDALRETLERQSEAAKKSAERTLACLDEIELLKLNLSEVTSSLNAANAEKDSLRDKLEELKDGWRTEKSRLVKKMRELVRRFQAVKAELSALKSGKS